jgi:hypothetical protein
LPNTAILYLTHYATESLINRFFALRSDCQASGYDAFLLYDETRSAPLDIAGGCVYSFDIGSLTALGFTIARLGGRPAGIVPGHNDYPLIAFYLSHPTYDDYWVIEYDVRFTGRWTDFFDACGQSRADLLATHVQRFTDNELWCWWDSLTYKHTSLGRHELVRAFFPTYRLTASACAILAQEYRKGWIGHSEVRLPTILALNGCTLEDIGGEGSFVPPGHENRFYLGENTRPSKEATFRWRPVMLQPGTLPHKLWHPVKSPFSSKSPRGRRP